MNIVQIQTESGIKKGIGIRNPDGEVALLSGIVFGREKMPLEANPALFDRKKIVEFNEFIHLFEDEYLSYKKLGTLEKAEIIIAYLFMGGGSRLCFDRLFIGDFLYSFNEPIKNFAYTLDLSIPEVLVLFDSFETGVLKETEEGILLVKQDKLFMFSDRQQLEDLKLLIHLAAEKAMKIEEMERDILLEQLEKKLS